MVLRLGLGYDIHRLVPDRPLILGGIHIPFEKGLLGHSDADVLTHAIIDAMLGALALGSIGEHFPDTDPQYKDINSLELLAKTVGLIHEKGYEIGNIDTVIVAENPRLSPFSPAISQQLSRVLGCPIDAIGIKATRGERLGFEGRGEGISARAIVMLRPII